MTRASLRPRMPSPPDGEPGDDFGREGAPETEDAAEARERWEAER